MSPLLIIACARAAAFQLANCRKSVLRRRTKKEYVKQNMVCDALVDPTNTF